MDNDSFQRFDMARHPIRCRWFLKPIAWAISLPNLIKHRTQITKINMKGLRPPYILLGNHNAFFDMSVSLRATFPNFGNYIVAIDGFIGRESLLRNIGCICKRKFTNDVSIIRNIRYVIQKKGIVAIYPEARYSLCGTTAPLPESLGQLIKLLKVPVVTIICHGHHINHPFWNTRHERGVRPTEAEVKLLFSSDQIETLSADDINDTLVREFQYDDFAWQLKKKIQVNTPDRAVGLEKILYQCPHCHTEFKMVSSGAELTCQSCGKSWHMNEYGQLHSLEGDTEFTHIPDWYEWERRNVRQEVEAGTYSSGKLPVEVESLPNSRGFIKLGSGYLTHDMSGFKVIVNEKTEKEVVMEKAVPSMYSCHIEFNYLFKHGDCVDLNTLQDTWYIYPHDCLFSVTKIALATEELYFHYRSTNGKPCRPGLA